MESKKATQVVLIYGAMWVAWKVLKRALGVAKNPLNNLPGPAPGAFMQGHFEELWDPVRGWDFHNTIAKTYGSVVALSGPLGAKSLYVYDPKALYHIFIKDRDIFEETEGFLIGSDMTWGRGLFAASGEQHRKQRRMINSVFSITHLRHLVPIFYDVTNKLRETLVKKVATGPQEVDFMHWMGRTALELIGQGGLGYSFDPLTEGAEEHVYSRCVKEFDVVSTELMAARHLVLPYVHNIGSARFRRWIVGILPWKALRDMRDIVDVMESTSIEVVESKKRVVEAKLDDEAMAKQVGMGKDIISVLVKANMEADEQVKLSDIEVVGQVSGLISAAMDTTANALCRTVHLLSENQSVQDKARQEIREAHKKYGKDRLDYDELMSLPYLDAVCRETLRVYPPVPTVMRETRQDVFLPFSKPLRGKEGEEIDEILVPKGTLIFPSVLSSNINPDIWGPDADEWKPERWIDGLPESVADARIPGVFSHLMTFIGGGRACIGFKFSQLEMKVVLCVLLNTFKFSSSKDKEIYWKMTGIVTPSVCGDSGESKTEMPLIVSLAD